MEYFISQLVNGICQGSIYALMAIGYSVIVGVVGFVTFTYGEVVITGAFGAFIALSLCGKNIFLAFIVSFVSAWIIGAFVYKICYERFLEAPRHIALICTIGMSIFLKNLIQIIFGPNKKPMVDIIDNTIFKIGIVEISKLQLVIIATVIVLSGLLFYVFRFTRWGTSLRAVSQDKKAAALMGISVKKTTMLGNCIGCGLAGVAGFLVALNYQTLYATMGSTFGMKAFSAAVLGGLTSVPLAAFGGLCIGIIENLGIAFLSATFRDIFAFGFLILVLIIRPQGFGKQKGARP